MTDLKQRKDQSLISLAKDKQLETLSQLHKMASTGGQEMVIRILP